ncbi:MAG TPA: MASE4 domain-containing protein [Burkholderiales bacterium]|nr:MASE4 domain-containing protein [Burkholderiales bacterium]
MPGTLANEHRALVSTLPPGRSELRLALFIVLISAAVFLTAIPFAKVPLPQYPSFILFYDAAVVVTDLATAFLLIGQFGALRAPALLVLSCGYVFTAFLAIPHALTFPGLFSATGLLGASPQSTAWIYMFWHGGFPLFVIAYAMLKGEGRETRWPRGRLLAAVLLGSAALVAILSGLTMLATTGKDLLPAIMVGNHYSPAMIFTVSSVWTFSLVALIVLWLRRPHTVLDLWLVVVMCAWLFNIALAAVFNGGRFDFGFYAGRIYGLLAVSFVLIALLIENSWLSLRLAREYEGRVQALRRNQDKARSGPPQEGN